MKKIFAISFIALYLILTVGVNILVHTCSGESDAMFAAVKIEDPCVCGENMPVDNMCCRTELKTIKVNDVQTSASVTIEQNLVLIGIIPAIEISASAIRHSSFVIVSDTSPPPNKDLNISNSVFLI